MSKFHIVTEPNEMAPHWTELVGDAEQQVCMAVRGAVAEVFFADNLQIACPDGRCIEISWTASRGLKIVAVGTVKRGGTT